MAVLVVVAVVASLYIGHIFVKWHELRRKKKNLTPNENKQKL